MTELFNKDGAGPGPRPLDSALPAVRALLRRSLDSNEPVLAAVMQHLRQDSGKNIRAALLLAAAADPAGLVSQDAILAATALELLP